ncbi:MAG TPA: hypothetical protein VLX11_04460 [Candidatus Acidoferrales bacterium]|nr:hypothetical protein [Candidatus Acidoferrales bacterium]
MNPLLIGAIPVVLIIIGMILNSLNLSFNQPESSPEQDPVKRLAAERQAFRQFFDLQRSRAIKRQKRVGQYAWLIMIATIGSFIWFYVDTVKKTNLADRIASLQTLSTEEGKQTVLSVTQVDGDNTKYLIKPDKNADTTKAQASADEKVSSWEVQDLGTALSESDKSLPLGISLKIANSN